ncbi:hypothetical protein AK830_g716 [Neonectria ditissima]|uniref:Heterokaryon incompatibility domain-containing protein n=1 Tax=Neonectria ditissima TaxID=78410 RepID=A0A0P7BKV9_9HYPO|nr:hypothetical protein AK830_g716 [Neonectria ditissima]
MSQSSSCCGLCPTHVSSSGGDDRVLRRWSSFAELDRSANNGCDLCILFRHHLAIASSVDKLRQHSGGISLHSSGDRWSLECAAFPGALVLPFLDSPSELRRTSSPENPANVLDQANTWLRRCLSSHPDCQGDTGSSYSIPGYSQRELPKRLVDLIHGDILQVFSCEDRIRAGLLSADHAEYCCLSYRWGTSPHSSVLTRPFSVTWELPLSVVPQTFQDAVNVTRQLGIRYIWIDALCIVQPTTDDETEWLEEGSRMGVIYRNAICTIAATASLHANQGFLEQTGKSYFGAEPVEVSRYRDAVEPKFYIPIRTPDFYSCVSRSPLNKRGWVVQERALSTRILHFADQGLFWECGELKAHSPHGTLQDRDDFPSCRSRETLLSVARTKRTSHICPVEWFHFVKQYSFTNFTNPQDRLLALSSVAKAVQPYLGGHEYIAGLWTNDVVRGLAWKSCHPKTPSNGTVKPAAPSWSWASAVGGIELGVFSFRMYRYNLVDVITTSAIAAQRSNPYGCLSYGSITLKGKLTFETLTRTARFENKLDLSVYWDEIPRTESTQGSGSHQLVTPSPQPEKYVLLPIAEETIPLSSITHIGALILEPAGQPEVVQSDSGDRLRTEFRRLGWIEYTYRHHDLKDRRRYWIEREPEEIVLV